MCRQLAYIGPPMSLESLLLSPAHSLLHQSYRPRYQNHGVVNADGFGCGWFDKGIRPEPALYRRDKPIWSDTSFSSLAPLIRSGAVVASVRDATPGSAAEETSALPFAEGRWLYAHNGKLDGFYDHAGTAVHEMVSKARRARIRGTSDSEILFALVMDLLDTTDDPAGALLSVIRRCRTVSGGTFNFILHDGSAVTATAAGESLFVLEGSSRVPGGVAVASEPYDDDPAWRRVPDASLVRAAHGRVDITPIKEEDE
ncbi:MAG: ergothioneine biosynthesis protein EgtC [Actinomycetota bacterium]